MNNILEFYIHDISITLDELVWKITNEATLSVRQKLFEEYKKYDRLGHLYEYCLADECSDFDWNYLQERGYLCLHDYKLFEALQKEPFLSEYQRLKQEREKLLKKG